MSDNINNTNAREIKLPDFDDLFKLIEQIRQLSVEKMKLEWDIKFEEANIVLEVSSNPKYFISGKAPSMTFIKDTYLKRGIEDSLIERRYQLANMISELEFLKNSFQLNRDMISVFQTESANKRSSVL